MLRGYHRLKTKLGAKESAEAAKSTEWTDFSAYLQDYYESFLANKNGSRQQGLEMREQAFAALERFVCSLEHQPFPERRRFVSWLMNSFDGTARFPGAPASLWLRVVKPTLLEWITVEPRCSEPHRWLGGAVELEWSKPNDCLSGYDLLTLALQLDQDDEIARFKLIALILRDVGIATHELPAGYLGDPERDLTKLAEAEQLLPQLSNDEDRKKFAADIQVKRQLIQEYLSGRE